MSIIIYYSFGIITQFFRIKKKNSKNFEHNLAGPTEVDKDVVLSSEIPVSEVLNEKKLESWYEMHF